MFASVPIEQFLVINKIVKEKFKYFYKQPLIQQLEFYLLLRSLEF